MPGTPGTDCIPGTPEKGTPRKPTSGKATPGKDIPATSGNDGTAAKGEAFSQLRKYAAEPGVGSDETAGTPGANAGTLPSDAGIPRSSASGNGATGVEAGIPGTPGIACMPG